MSKRTALAPGNGDGDRVVGAYELVRPVGSGGMGVVYEARHRSLGRAAAVKVMHAGALAGPSAQTRRARFLREGRAAARVRHPHIVDVFDFGIHDGVPFLAMEFIEGETLEQLLERSGPLSLASALAHLLPITAAVAELHAAGIVHRDLKPANILLPRTMDGPFPKLSDFGVSRMDDDAAGLTPSDVMLGTIGYMAPEQALDPRTATDRCDQYALGVILYRCVTGSLPFRGDAPYRLLHAIIHESPPPPSALVPGVPASLDAVIARAMSRDPEARFPSVDDLAEALLELAPDDVRTRWTREFSCESKAPADTWTKSAPRESPAVPAPRRAIDRVTAGRVPRWSLVAAAIAIVGARVAMTPPVGRPVAPSPSDAVAVVMASAAASPATRTSAPARPDAPLGPPLTTAEPSAPTPVPATTARPKTSRPSPRRRSPEVGENDAPILEIE